MQEPLLYMGKVMLYSGLLYGYYLLALKNRKLHQYNRAYLLISAVLSLVLPLLHFEWYRVDAARSQEAVRILQVISGTGGEQEVTTSSTDHIDIWQVMQIIYIIVSAAMAIHVIRHVLWIDNLRKKGRVEQRPEYDIIYTDVAQAPFSFFSTVYWKAGTDINSPAGSRILAHELSHIRQWHTVDKLFMHGILIVCWINPVYWLMRQELVMVHEFIADDAAIEAQDSEAFALMLLQSHYGNMLPDITNSFYSSPIKRRLYMLTETKKTTYAKMRKLLVLPVLALPLALFSFTINNGPVVKSDKKAVLVLDAAHGGTDNGATNGNVKEKDLTLLVANRIAELAPEYNVEVIKTRTGDEYPTLQQRVEKANKVSADLFLSIHVNGGQEQRQGNDYELIISKPNTKYSDCKVFASILSAKMNSINIGSRLIEKNLLVLKENAHAAVAIECGHIDDARNLAMMSDKEQLDKLCRSILSGVVAFKNAR